MSDIKTSFHKAAELVKSWGESKLSDGKSVEELCTIAGISFWSAISPMLALGHLGARLSHPSKPANFLDYCRAFTKKAKRLAFNAAIPLVASRTGCGEWPCNPTFLFLGFSYYMYRETLQPLAERLANRSDCAVTILDDVFSIRSRKPSDNALLSQSLWQHWDNEVTQTARKMRRDLKVAAARLTSPSGLPAIVASSNLGWLDVKPVFNWLFDGYLPRMVNQAAIALHIMGRHRPQLLISPDVHDPRTRIFCLAGQLAGIKTLEIQFGFYGINDIEWRFFLADHLAVTGAANMEVMIDHGIPREKMTLTGSARYDHALSWPPELVRTVRNNLGLPDSKVMVLFASQPFYFGAFSTKEIRDEMMRALLHAAAELDELVLVVKPHPLEDPAELASLATGLRNIVFADKLLDIRDLIKAADAFVTFFSGTAFDALVMNKPTINLAFPGACANNLFEQCGATFVARTADDINRIMNSIAKGQIEEIMEPLAPARERFLQQWFYLLDGCAKERIERIALEMAPLEPVAKAL